MLNWAPLRIFWSSAVFAVRALFSWLRPEMWLMQVFMIPLFQIAFFVYLARFINPQASVTYVAVGNALQVSAFASIFAVCNLTSEEKWQGTLIPIIATPASRFPLFIGRAMVQVLNSIATVAVGLFYAMYVFAVDMSQANLPALALVVIMTSLTMTGFGLMLASVGLYLRTAMIIANIFLFLGLLLCGVNFPVTDLPAWLQPFSYTIPMTYGTIAARAAVNGQTTLAIAPILLQQLLVGAASIILGYLLFVGFEELSRQRGTLEEF